MYGHRYPCFGLWTDSCPGFRSQGGAEFNILCIIFCPEMIWDFNGSEHLLVVTSEVICQWSHYDSGRHKMYHSCFL